MLLAVDIGNTNTVFGVVSEDEILYQFRIETVSNRTEDEYFLLIKDLLEIQDIGIIDIKDIVISCVVPVAINTLERFFQKYCQINPIRVDHSNHGVTFNGVPARHIGSDLGVNAIAASHITQKDCLIIDCGTATTFAMLESSALDYKGIAIAPGANSMIKCLHHETAQLPLLNFSSVSSVFGHDTKNSMLSGSYFGFLGLVSGIIHRVKLEYQKDFIIIATGGLSYFIKDHIYEIDIVEPDLTLLGLKFFYERMKRLQ